MLERFIEEVKSTGSARNMDELNKQVNALLIEPLSQVITGRALIIIPDGILYRIPFELIQDGHGKLIDHHTIQYEYSAKLLLKNAFSTAAISYTGFAPNMLITKN
ncbi:MAG: CHAT domain-containing protein [Saprospiraceae bacterium]|nr:CHAT domain-containing protein [Saprospiraceae bacterium]